MKWILGPFFLPAMAVAVPLLILPGPAASLSCAPPSMSLEIYKASAAVFTGRVQGSRSLTSQELDILESHGIRSFSGTMEELQISRVLVGRSWKGPSAGDEVLVYRDTYWGDSLSENADFLFVTGRRIEHIYEAELCGNTLPLAHAVPLLEELEKIAPQ